jgi:hypothetical protein
MSGAITPTEPAPEPRRAKFAEAKLPSEPKSDVKLTLESGMVLRERVQRVETGGATNLLLTFTKLDSSGRVERDASGDPIVSPAHEIAFIPENTAHLSDAAIAKALKDAREAAAARAEDHFKGMARISGLMASRL